MDILNIRNELIQSDKVDGFGGLVGEGVQVEYTENARGVVITRRKIERWGALIVIIGFILAPIYFTRDKLDDLFMWNLDSDLMALVVIEILLFICFLLSLRTFFLTKATAIVSIHDREIIYMLGKGIKNRIIFRDIESLFIKKKKSIGTNGGTLNHYEYFTLYIVLTNKSTISIASSRNNDYINTLKSRVEEIIYST
jgi:hypothetical protein